MLSKVDFIKIVLRTKELLAQPEAWLQGRLALDKNNEAVPVLNENAKRFCLIGAMERAVYDILVGGVKEKQYLFHQDEIVYGNLLLFGELDAGLVNWNDDLRRTHAEVLAMLDKVVSVAHQPKTKLTA